MKLKSLKITTFLFLTLSFQNLMAAEELSALGCRTDEIYETYDGAQRESCDSYRAKYSAATDDEKVKLTKRFEDTAKTARIKAAEAAAKSAANLSGDQYCKSDNDKAEPAEAKQVHGYGSSGFANCDKLSMGNMASMYKNGSYNPIPWEAFINYSCREFCGKEKKNSNHPFDNCKKKAFEVARKCESVAYMYNAYGRKWDNPDQVAATESSSSGNGIGAKTQQSANGGTATVAIGAASSIKCVSKGIETVDYDSCKEFQVKLDLLEGMQQVAYTGQELVYKEKMSDAQLKYSDEKNTATGALKAQGESLKDQEGMFQQRTVVDAAKLGYLYTIYNEFPKASEVEAKCDNITIQIPGDPSNAKISSDECKAAVRAGQGGFAVTMNQQQIENMRARLISIATSAGSNLLLANLLGKRADDVNNAIAKIDAFKPADPFTTTEADAQTTFCRMNPGVASCLTGDLERTFDTMNDNIITFGDGATGTSYGNNTNADGTPILNNVTDSTSRTAVGPVGSVIAAAAQDNSMEKSDAASVKSGGVGASGGGGGGSGGGASGGGGGGSPTAAAAGQAAAIAGRAPSYNGGGGTFSVMGGFGINKKKAEGKTEDNPFGKLFGKDGANKGDVNFRDIASQKVGGKGDNLFDMISKRYSSVNADKRLLEYELKK